MLLEKPGGLEKSLGAFQPDYALTAPGEFKAGSADGTPELESSGTGRNRFPLKSFSNAACGKVGQLQRGCGRRKLPLRRTIMENQVLCESMLGLVEGGAHPIRPSSF